MGHVVITGGSSGIGAAFAALLLKRGERVTLVARDSQTLARAVAGFGPPHAGNVQARQADVTDARGLRAAIADASEAFGPCAMLIASAGIVRPGRFAAQDGATFDEQIRVNLIGAANAVRAVYPDMTGRPGSRILLIGSGAALIGLVGYTAYCASKAGLHGFAEALRAEARQDGISVSICHPPDTETPQLAGELPHRPPEASLVIGKAGVRSAEAVAGAALAAAERGQFAIYPDTTLSLLATFGSLANPLLRRIFDRRIDAFRRSQGR